MEDNSWRSQTSKETVEGCSLIEDTHYMVTNTDRMEAVYEDPKF